MSVLSSSDELVPWSPLGWRSGSVLPSPGAPCLGREGELPQRCEALALGAACPCSSCLQGSVRTGPRPAVLSAGPQPGTALASSSASLCAARPAEHRGSRSIAASLAFLPLPVLHRCMCWFLTQNWAVREAVAQHRGWLALNSQTWSRGRCVSELSCLFLQFSLRVYNIAINSTGEEIPSKNVAYSYQAMS